MTEQDLKLTSKVKFYYYMQIVKVILGSLVAIYSFLFLNLGKFDFFTPYLGIAIIASGILAICLKKTIDIEFKWSPFIITTFDVGSFIFCVYISDFTYNTIFFWLAGLIVMTYFFTNVKFAIGQLLFTIIFIVIWVISGMYDHTVINTDATYNNAFFISSSVNLLFVFAIFHFNEKIKNEYQSKLIEAKNDFEKINTFPLYNPNPIFEYNLKDELTPKNKIAREFILISDSKKLEQLMNFSKSVLDTKENSNLLLHFDDREYMINGVYIKGKINLYLTDVSELMETRRIFEEKEQYNRAIIDAMPGFVSWIDRDHKYLGVNDHMCKFFHKKAEDFIGLTVGEVAKDGGDNIISDLVNELFENDIDLLQKEFSFDFNDKTFWSYITLKKYNDGNNAVLVSTDTTKHKKAENQIREEQIKSETSAKLAAFGEMAAGIAHEINNPLAILNGIGFRLKKLKSKDMLTEEKFSDLINKLFYGVERISKIITGMKYLSREGTNDNFDFAKLQDILDDSLVLLSKKCTQSDIDLKISDIPENFGFVCQRVQISQTLVILINNSIDAIEEQEEGKWIEIDIAESDEVVTISVSDSGTGISKYEAQRIFEPFYTTKGVGKGTGLGLSLANKIVKAHGGDFSLDEASSNTKFVMTFPKTFS